MFNLTPYSHRHDMMNYNPFRELEEMERQFFGTDAFGAFKTDIRDNGKEYILEADLPGFKKEDVQIDIDGNTLNIRAERHSAYEEKDKKGNYLKCERSYGSFARSFDISGVKQADIQASYQDGVLKLILPKKDDQASQSRRLEIN
jgi:HSP20 family protein